MDEWSRKIVEILAAKSMKIDQNYVVTALNQVLRSTDKVEQIVVPNTIGGFSNIEFDNVGTPVVPDVPFGGFAEPDEQGKSLLCVVYSLGKAIAQGFMCAKWEAFPINFDQNHIITALMQHIKTIDKKKPLDYNTKDIFLRDDTNHYWIVTMNITDITQDISQVVQHNSNSEFLLGLNKTEALQHCGINEDHCVFVEKFQNQIFECINSFKHPRFVKPKVPLQTLLGKPKPCGLFRVCCTAAETTVP